MVPAEQTDMRYIFDFVEGSREMSHLLGGKGANLAEMARIGLPVPPGFTITTEACRYYLLHNVMPDQIQSELHRHLSALEQKMGKRLGEIGNPLLVSVRSGAKYSMPGMMETILNVGLNDESVRGLAEQARNERFAWDSYRRLIQMYGKTVVGIDGDSFEEALAVVKSERGVIADTELDAADLQRVVELFKRIVHKAGKEFPQDPSVQLKTAIEAVFQSWNAERAVLYRRQERIPDDAGTAVNIVAMVFGNLGNDSGTGVAFTRDPSTGAPGAYGDYLANAQGEDVVAGIRNTVPLAELETLAPNAYAELRRAMSTLEEHYRDLCDIEFTVERGKLWLLQTRVGKRTAAAAFRIARQLVQENVIDVDEAVHRVNGAQLAQLMFPQFDADALRDATLLAKGIPASPGAAVGKAVFDADTAVEWAAKGEDVILVRRETNPDDLAGMIAAQGILTSRGGKTSHAAVVARGMGKTCVCGAESLDIDVANRRFTTTPADVVVNEGDLISVDGGTGAVYAGLVAARESDVVKYFAGDQKPETDLLDAVDVIMRHADSVRRMCVRANADTGEDAERARQFGAEGIGLCRTEHMFLGERREYVERLILAENEREQEAAFTPLLPLQRADFTEILRAMNGLPVTIRLLDPPLHEFLPDFTDLSVRIALAAERGDSDVSLERQYAAVRRLHEQNPMLGLRGVRLGLMIPGLFAMQTRAIAEAAVTLQAEGMNPQPEIMIPLVGAARELELIRSDVERILREVFEESGSSMEIPIGTMIELPRAALTAGEIAGSADFFSYGTNDLTQTAWGFSRDDVEASFFKTYLDKGIFESSPFEVLDVAGVGELVQLGTERGRAVKRDLKVGICGEHGGDPESIHFFDGVGLDYVSCSPFRVPIARLEAARATLEQRGGTIASDSR